MIKVNDNGELEFKGEPDLILSQVRLIVEALSTIPEMKNIYKKSKFWKPETSDKEIRNIILSVCEEVYKK